MSILPALVAIASWAFTVLAAVPYALGDENSRGGIRFVAPWAGSHITAGPVVIAGRLPAGGGQAYFLHNRRPLGGITVKGNVFSGAIEPFRGLNEIEVRRGETTARLSFAYGVGTGQAPYVFHRPIVEGKCDPCHGKAGGRRAPADASTCYGCHPATSVMYPHVHGPVASGACLICHEPHGSSFTGLARSRPDELCLSCHDQPTTAEHTSSRTRVCTLCHHPHFGTNKRFLRDTF